MTRALDAIQHARRLRALAVGASILAVAACGSPQRTPVEAAHLAQQNEDTTLGSGDVFEVRVYGEEQLSDRYRVAQDGTIDFPLVGRLAVRGLEPTAVADLVRSELLEGEFLRDPQVSVFVVEYNSKRISTLGEVRNPGTFAMQSGLTVVQAISLAGGFTPMADRNGTTVTRRVDGRLQTYAIPVGRVMEGREEDFPLKAGDLVYVPQRVF